MNVRQLTAASLFIIFALASCRAGATTELATGLDKPGAIEALRRLGVARVALGVYPVVEVTSDDDLHLLQDAEGVIIGAGEVRIGFVGDSVGYLNVAPVFPKWRQALDRATTREAALNGLATIMRRSPGVVVRSCPYENLWVHLDPPSAIDTELLAKYDRWSANYDSWHLTLHFKDDKLVDVNRRWAPQL